MPGAYLQSTQGHTTLMVIMKYIFVTLLDPYHPGHIAVTNRHRDFGAHLQITQGHNYITFIILIAHQQGHIKYIYCRNTKSIL